MLSFETRRKRVFAVFVFLVIIVGAMFAIPIPYYITQPGSAIELQPIIEVGEGGAREDGTFMLVTVSMLDGNVAFYLYALVSPYADFIKYDRLLGHEETPEEYHERQLYAMQQSQDDAILAAYNYAANQLDVSAEAHSNGVRVLRTVPGLPAEEVLQPGDVIHQVDGEQVETAEDLLVLLKKKRPREVVTLSVNREGEQQQVEVVLDVLPSSDNEGEEHRVGLGVYPVTNRVVTSTPEVSIHTNEIGGPSAGLMMALEIYNQLSPTDLTKGYRIAGTGTINPQGKVGQIGSVEHKVVAADVKEVDIFFVPKDVKRNDRNEAVAAKTARKLGTQMKVVPVASLEDAVNYLDALPDGT